MPASARILRFLRPLLLAVAVLGLGVAVAQASPSHAGTAAPAAIAAPAAVHRASSASYSCVLAFGGGTVKSTIIVSKSGYGYTTVTVSQHNSVPRRITFRWNAIHSDHSGPHRGITSLAAGETGVWVAYDVWIDEDTAFTAYASDAHGNSDWNTCYMWAGAAPEQN